MVSGRDHFLSQGPIISRVIILAISVTALPFLLNLTLFKAIANPAGTLFSNYSYTLYGLASGNKGWTQVLNDHPGIDPTEIMSLALRKISSDPSLFLRGVLSSYRDYFTPLGGAFTFVIYSLYSFRAKANIILWILTLTGLAFAGSNWKKGSHTLVLASFIGVFASVTLVPPIDWTGCGSMPLLFRSQHYGWWRVCLLSYSGIENCSNRR